MGRGRADTHERGRGEGGGERGAVSGLPLPTFHVEQWLSNVVSGRPDTHNRERRKEVIQHVRKKHRKQRAVSAFDVALEACRALVPTDLRPRPDIRRATVLARFAVAMTK